ncbi:MAG TPA: hypothetical protein IAC66_07645 [Candidatus Aphodousia gallistercoris]|nr:hypothetical protein [Candidatus Aphodousia gallistercoris]
MCDDSKTPIQRVVAGLTASGAGGVAKASPGIAVTSAGVMGFPIETWVSILTCCYLLFMLVGAMPKVIEALRYLYRLAKPKRESSISVTEVPDQSVTEKLEKVKHE